MTTEIWTPRISYTNSSVTSLLIVDGEQWKAAVLEDRLRVPGVKVHGQTAIPAGRYKLAKLLSPKFKREMIWLRGVTGFEFIYAHAGNKAEDSEGCLLLAETRLSWDKILGNALAIERRLFSYVEARGFGNAFWTVTDGPLARPYLEGA